MTLTSGATVAGVVLNQSVGEMQLLGDDRRFTCCARAASAIAR